MVFRISGSNCVPLLHSVVNPDPICQLWDTVIESANPFPDLINTWWWLLQFQLLQLCARACWMARMHLAASSYRSLTSGSIVQSSRLCGFLWIDTVTWSSSMCSSNALTKTSDFGVLAPEQVIDDTIRCRDGWQQNSFLKQLNKPDSLPGIHAYYL